MENKDLKERKEEFKQVASQTIPVMGLEPERDSNTSDSADDDPEKKCKDCEITCYWGNNKIYREADDCKDCAKSCNWGDNKIYREADDCKDCAKSCDWGNNKIYKEADAPEKK